jgi:hypothetical protein
MYRYPARTSCIDTAFIAGSGQLAYYRIRYQFVDVVSGLCIVSKVFFHQVTGVALSVPIKRTMGQGVEDGVAQSCLAENSVKLA